MQTVPSLIGTGTAVAAAATGLVFGQLVEGQLPPPLTPRSHSSRRQKQRQTTPESDAAHAVPSRPSTTSSAATAAAAAASQAVTASQPGLPRRSSYSQTGPPKASYWRQPAVKQSEFGVAPPIAEDSRDSFSSNQSRVRRLSVRPMSHHESLRSSIGPDSQSIAFSHGSGAPMLPSASSNTPQQLPNKLVKRSSASDGPSTGPLARRSSRTQMPTLRRPATSHQRSATLYHLSPAEVPPPLPKFSLDQQSRPRARTLAERPQEQTLDIPTNDNTTWRSFFHARITRIVTKTSTIRGDPSHLPAAQRLCVDQQRHERAYLLTPRSVMAGREPEIMSSNNGTTDEAGDSPASSNKTDTSPGATPSRTPKRSISMQFNSPTTWISKSGSIRRLKRGALDAVGGTKRHTSDPVFGIGETDMKSADHSRDRVGEPSRAETELAAIFHPPGQQRQSSSPHPSPPNSHVDRNRLGSSALTGNQPKPDETINANNAANPVRVNSNTSHPRTLDRASTVGSSEYHQGFTSGEDDDTDAKTDTPFDSLRTVASGRRRTVDSPLESMFDESPPSTAGNNKPKRLSIQEILGPAFDTGSRIMEEDEGLTTPIRSTYDDAEVRFRSASFQDNVLNLAHPSATLHDTGLDRDFSRLSFDDDDDLDWARDDEEPVYNHLSPPSLTNSRKGSPNLRTALASISGNGSGKFDGRQDLSGERPRSNIFDWVEPAPHDKPEVQGQASRPKTVHGKQELEVRGGRSASRKGPVATHVRSQSVPVVQDPTDSSKPAPKFGTWGLSKKNVSEDWDDDFEFEELEVGPSAGQKAENRLSMVVPVSIQATQPTVKAHSSQIRELSLLVNDLKRLCRLGREMNLASGSSTKLWREAEGIIALASPDEDSTEDRLAPTTVADHAALPDGGFLDGGDHDEGSDETRRSNGSPTQMRNAVVKDRPVARRRSVFSPDDDIFGNRAQVEENVEVSARPRTPEHQTDLGAFNPSSVARSLMESMQLRWRQPGETDDDDEDEDPSHGRLNFDTNSLRELVKRAGDLRDLLADQVRKAEHITNSPVRTPRRERAGGKNPDGSPAFTRVFDDPAPSPTRRLQNGHGSKSPLSDDAVNGSPSTGLSRRLQMMTVS